MAPWMFWFIAAVLLILAEMLTGTFYLLWLGIAALFGAVLTWLFPDNNWLAPLAASAVALVLAFFTRPLTEKLSPAKGYKDPIDHLIGKSGEVVESIPAGGLGIVRIGTETWSATAEQNLLPGMQVKVISRSATIITVSLT